MTELKPHQLALLRMFARRPEGIMAKALDQRVTQSLVNRGFVVRLGMRFCITQAGLDYLLTLAGSSR